MPTRQFPVFPDLEQLRKQAKDLLKQVRAGDPAALADHPTPISPDKAKLADAQLALARSYGIASWPRLVLACRMTDAIRRDDLDAVRSLIAKHPNLLHENARGTAQCNWGPPMSFAANLGRDRIIQLLASLGAADVQHAFDRACLQGRIETARTLYERGARLTPGIIMGPCETLCATGLKLQFELGATPTDEHGDRLAPLGMLLETYCRNPAGKHACIDLLAERGLALPDTPIMAFHRGRIDLLEEHLSRDPQLVHRRFTLREIYPLEAGCHEDETLGLHGAHLGGATLLHIAADYDEIEIARWLLDHGADVNAPAAIDSDGFGGQTPLFHTVVCQAHISGCRRDDGFARLLLDRGANPSARASVRKAFRFNDDESMHEYRDVTPLSLGRRFHGKRWVNPAALQLIAERGGKE